MMPKKSKILLHFVSSLVADIMGIKVIFQVKSWIRFQHNNTAAIDLAFKTSKRAMVSNYIPSRTEHSPTYSLGLNLLWTDSAFSYIDKSKVCD